MKKVYSLILLVLGIACTNNSPTDKKVDLERQRQFKRFFEKFTPIDVPVIITIDFQNDFKVSNNFDFRYQEINNRTNDSLFLNVPGPCWSSGYMPDTSNYFALVYGMSGAVRIYKLVTFDKHFNKISDTLILNEKGCYPATPCLKCNTTIKFNEDNTIQCIDTLYQLDCDSLGRTNDIVQNMKVLHKRITINEKGAIVIK